MWSIKAWLILKSVILCKFVWICVDLALFSPMWHGCWRMGGRDIDTSSRAGVDSLIKMKRNTNRNDFFVQLLPRCIAHRDVKFGLLLSQIVAKWDKSGTFLRSVFLFILAHRAHQILKSQIGPIWCLSGPIVVQMWHAWCIGTARIHLYAFLRVRFSELTITLYYNISNISYDTFSPVILQSWPSMCLH